MYEARNQDEILAELQEQSSSKVSSYEGTFVYDAFAADSIEFAKQEVEREQAYKAMFARSSWGEYLEMRAEEHGIFRRQATYAKGTVTVTGTGNVPVGSKFQTAAGLSFHTLTETFVRKSAELAVECDVTGVQGNVDAGTVAVIPMSIPGISKVTNAEPMHDGFDEEEDDSLYNRLIFKVRQPATSGNINDYIEWATGVPGVGKVKVLPLWNGNGTVKVLITDSNGDPASDTLINQVADVIEGEHPIGATVTVAAPEVLTLTVSLKVIKGAGDAEAIREMLNKYFTSTNFDGTRISIAEVGHMILDNPTTGVTDYDDLALNGKATSISVTDEQLPNVTEVVFNG